mmetsp:Transcript_11310/g.32095  ORF Transcript_11310/g.32095 Transcript_11310/m.32095 type:complete len:98 (+) Transcript_11310:723-1016(+)
MKEAWDEVIQLSQVSGIMKLPRHFRVTWTVAQQSVWNPARDALKKERRRLQAARSRAVKTAPDAEEVGGHVEEPEYRAVAGLQDAPTEGNQPPLHCQ